MISATLTQVSAPAIHLLLPKLAQPILVLVEQEPSQVVLVDTNTGVFGAGGTMKEAALDLEAALAEHLDVLRRSPNLSPSLLRQLDILTAYFSSD